MVKVSVKPSATLVLPPSSPCPVGCALAVAFPGLVLTAAAAAAKSLQSCPTLCDPLDGSPPGSPIPGILQARILEWVAISFSRASSLLLLLLLLLSRFSHV